MLIPKLGRILLLFLLALLTSKATAQLAVENNAPLAPTVITSYADISLVPVAKARNVYPARIEFLIYYHDPAWKIAWGNYSGGENFLPLGALPFPSNPGQRVLIEGTVIPANGLTIESPKYTLLSEAEPLPAPLPIRGDTGQVEHFDKKRVELAGYVEQQTLIDSRHLKLDVIYEGRPVIVRALIDSQTLLPDYQGMMIKAGGVYSVTMDPAGAAPKLELWTASLTQLEVLGPPDKPVSIPTSTRVITSFEELQQVPESRSREPHMVHLEFLVYFHDPRWRVAWGRCAGNDNYLALGEVSSALTPGQRVLIEGEVIPAKGMIIDHPKVTLLGTPRELNASPIAGRIGESENFDKRPVLIEGYADQQSVIDADHMKIDLITDDRAVIVRLLMDSKQTPPDLEGKRIRVTGVYSATSDPTGGPPTIELWVQGLDKISVLGTLAQDARFEIPATPIEQLASLTENRQIRLEGVVRSQLPGKSLTLRDATGEITVLTAQAKPLQIGNPVEVVGYTRLNDAKIQLRESLVRRSNSSAAAEAALKFATLRLAEQVRSQSPEEADRKQPVQLRGVVTWANSQAGYFFMIDHSGGVRVQLPPNQNSSRLMVGTRVDVVGVSSSGRYTPQVAADVVTATARLDPPESRAATLEQAMTGIEDAQWIAMSGYVRSVTEQLPYGRLELSTSAGEFTAYLPWSEQLRRLRGSVVRIQGVCNVVTNSKRQLTGIELWSASSQFISVEESEPSDLFAVPLRSISSLRQFGSLGVNHRRVRVAGTVIYHVPGEVLYIQDGEEGLLVLSQVNSKLAPGDRVEVVGFPGREHHRVVLREAAVQRISSGELPEARVIAKIKPIDVEPDGRLVKIHARLLNLSTQGSSRHLILEANDSLFEAFLSWSTETGETEWPVGSLLALTGVYQVEYDEYRRPHAVRLLLNSDHNVTVLDQAPWLTVGRALAAIGILAAVVVLGFMWVMALRRRVSQQTEQIREQFEKEKIARVEVAQARATKLESLGVLAGGIAHDFNNLLTVVLGNMSLAGLAPNLDEESKQYLQEGKKAAIRARDLTQQLITFAKGGDPVRSVTRLADVLREASQFALHGSKTLAEYDFANDAWLADVDRGQIGQVVHNLVINACQAMPDGGIISLRLRNECIKPGAHPSLQPGSYLCLEISDQGGGIKPELMSRIFDPYFTTKAKGTGLGLTTTYSIVKKHQGQIDVSSTLGVGTTFTIRLPAAVDDTVLPGEFAVPSPERPATPMPRCARVLVMDDDEAIRLLGGAMCKRLGYEHTLVCDGAELLREYEAALNHGRPYDLVVLDLTVPGGMGGPEAMEKLLALDPDVKAVVSSGYSNDPIMANYGAYGFKGVVTKPYLFTQMTDVLRKVLEDKPDLACTH